MRASIITSLHGRGLLAVAMAIAMQVLVASSGLAEEDHLVGYKVKDTGGLPPSTVFTLDNAQDPNMGCELKKPKFLLVRSEKNAGDDPRGGPAGRFLCYNAKCTTGLTLVQGEDQFFAPHSLEIKKPKLVCAPFIDLSATRFVDNGDGTVTDTQTHLTWEKKTDDSSVHDKDNLYDWSTNLMDPDGAAFVDFLGELNRCESTNGTTITGGFAGHCDWRLPTSAELLAIVDMSAPGCGSGGPCIDAAFGPTLPHFHWSSTTSAGSPSGAWYVQFLGGSSNTSSKASLYCVRAVRGGE